jgi:hypothetical protein
LAAVYIKVNLSHFLSQSQEGSGKEHGREKPENEDKRAAIELWRVKAPLSYIRKQLKMSERILRRILSFAKANPLNPIKPRKPAFLQNLVTSMPTRMLEVIEGRGE